MLLSLSHQLIVSGCSLEVILSPASKREGGNDDSERGRQMYWRMRQIKDESQSGQTAGSSYVVEEDKRAGVNDRWIVLHGPQV